MPISLLRIELSAVRFAVGGAAVLVKVDLAVFIIEKVCCGRDRSSESGLATGVIC